MTEQETCLKCKKKVNKLGWNINNCSCKEPETIRSLREDKDDYRFFMWFYYFAFILGVISIGLISMWKLGVFS